MMTETQTLEIIEVLNTLPSEKIAEVKDSAKSLHERYGKSQTIDESDEWTDKDLKDLVLSSLAYFEQTEQDSEGIK